MVHSVHTFWWILNQYMKNVKLSQTQEFWIKVWKIWKIAKLKILIWEKTWKVFDWTNGQVTKFSLDFSTPVQKFHPIFLGSGYSPGRLFLACRCYSHNRDITLNNRQVWKLRENLDSNIALASQLTLRVFSSTQIYKQPVGTLAEKLQYC